MATVPPTFDSATLSNVTLSANKLTASHSNTSVGGARVDAVKTSKKRYIEYQFTTVTGESTGVGVLQADGTYADFFVGQKSGSVYAGFGGPIFGNSAFSGKAIGGIVDGDWIGAAIDEDNFNIWFKNITQAGTWNGDGSDPATNTGGVSISDMATLGCAPAIDFGGTGTGATESILANFGASAFQGAVPSGFTAGWV